MKPGRPGSRSARATSIIFNLPWGADGTSPRRRRRPPAAAALRERGGGRGIRPAPPPPPLPLRREAEGRAKGAGLTSRPRAVPAAGGWASSALPPCGGAALPPPLPARPLRDRAAAAGRQTPPLRPACGSARLGTAQLGSPSPLSHLRGGPRCEWRAARRLAAMLKGSAPPQRRQRERAPAPGSSSRSQPAC